MPLMAMYGMAPIAGLDGGGFMADRVLVPYADAMLLPLPDSVDPVSVASLSDNIPDGWRAVAPYRSELAGLDPADRRVLVVGRQSIGLYATAFASALGARVDYVDTDPGRLAIAEKLGAVAHDRQRPDRSWEPYPVTVHTAADPKSLTATLQATWPDGVCTDTGIYYEPVAMALLSMYTRGVRFVTGRVNARAVIPEIIEVLRSGVDLAPVVDRVVPWDAADAAWPEMTGKTVFSRVG
jgi:threonine dehydrogenase-like Zn-dependent dehydrogenase